MPDLCHIPIHLRDAGSREDTEFVVNAIAAGEARESSLARLRLKYRPGAYRGAEAADVGWAS